MQTTEFAQYLARLDSLSSRLDMTAVLAELYERFSPDERQYASYLLQGSLVPQYRSLEFQLSSKMLLRAISSIAQQDSSQVEAQNLFGESVGVTQAEEVDGLYKKIGDIGVVAEQILSTHQKKQVDLSVLELHRSLVAIAKESGAGSQQRKLELTTALLQSLSPEMAKYVVRMIAGKLRLGFATMTLLDALSWAQTGTKDETKALESAYQKRADVGELARAYLGAKDQTARTAALTEYDVVFGTPIVPQLCQRLQSSEEIVEKLGEVIAEPKYDGLRIQLHIDTKKKQAFAYTRSLEDATHMFPELAGLFSQVEAGQVILDAEAIGYDPASGKLLPFQETITRKRKHDIAAQADNVPIVFYVYDLLYIDGRSLLDLPLSERKQLLRKIMTDSPSAKFTPYITTENADELRAFHVEQLSLGLEGAVVKKVDAPYQSGRKGWYWVKIKELAGTRGKLADTLDCLVLGYYVGKGKRTQFGVGAFLVGVLDGDNVLSLAKIGTGLTDEQFRELKQRCDDLAVLTQPTEYQVPKELFPDTWVRPGLVVEIAADELTKSPLPTAGLALRFPRLVRFRDDKKWQDATSLSELGSF
ncbi:MAG: ATP-dependent DNA ligase [bacterium]|nr:ATP-dependent DNA ligase [bacterium]